MTDANRLFDLVRKYDRPGPRYTSYPTAPHFSEAFGPVDFETELAGLRDPDAGPLSLYVHLPFCRSLCYYCGCHMIVTSRPESIQEYVDALKREIERVGEVAGGGRVVQLHWGGGTPTYLTPDQIRDLMLHTRRCFAFDADAEISLEGDPRGLTNEHLAAARESGFNRLSLGVQDFTVDVQEAVNRVQSVDMVRDATLTARQLGFHGVSFDLIYGLPKQTVESFLQTVDTVTEIGPDRISLFSYAHVPWKKKHQRVIDESTLPTPSDKINIFVEAVRRLTEGYRVIGMDHFALPNDPLSSAADEGTIHRNFQGYSTHADAQVIGMGLSAISQFSGAYAQHVLDLRDYYTRIAEGRFATARGYRLSEEDRLRRDIISSVMCGFEIDVEAIRSKYAVDFWTHFSDVLPHLRSLEEDALVELKPSGVRITDTGRYFVRNVAMAFDAYLAPAASSRRLYSRTV